MGFPDQAQFVERTKKFFSLFCPLIQAGDDLARSRDPDPSPDGSGRGLRVHWMNSLSVHFLAQTYEASLRDMLDACVPPVDTANKDDFSLKIMARPGNMVYGLNLMRKYVPELRPWFGWRTEVDMTQTFPKGSTVGYNSFILPRDSVLAILPVGWADG